MTFTLYFPSGSNISFVILKEWHSYHSLNIFGHRKKLNIKKLWKKCSAHHVNTLVTHRFNLSKDNKAQKFSLPSKSSEPESRDSSRLYCRMHSLSFSSSSEQGTFLTRSLKTLWGNFNYSSSSIQSGSRLPLLTTRPALAVWNFGMCGMGWSPCFQIVTW